MAANYGLMADAFAGVKEGLIAYQTAQNQKRQNQMFNLLHGVKENPDTGAVEYTPEKTKEIEEDRALKRSQIESAQAAKKMGLLSNQATLKKSGFDVDQTTGGLIQTPEGKEKDQVDLDYKKAQIAHLKNNKNKITPDAETKAASELRKEFQSRPGVKDFNTIQSAYEKVQSAANNPSAAGDLSLIFGYMKLLDPGSTVREGEFANAQNAGGVPDQVVNMYNRAKSGERLNPDQRKDFISQAKNVMKAQASQLKGIEDEFSDLSKRYRVDPGLIFKPRAAGLLQDSPPDMVRMIDPKGNIRLVSKDQVEAAIKAGGKLAK